MKVLLIQDVYKLGRAGDVKKVANGYGRNYLIPQGLAILATKSALSQADRIRSQADVQRAIINEEMSGVAEQVAELVLIFPAKAGETGKLYGSVSPQMIADEVNQKAGTEISRRQVDAQPIRTIGVHKVDIRLTMDLIPEITVVVHREGETPDLEEIEAGEYSSVLESVQESEMEYELDSTAAPFETVIEDEIEAAEPVIVEESQLVDTDMEAEEVGSETDEEIEQEASGSEFTEIESGDEPA